MTFDLNSTSGRTRFRGVTVFAFVFCLGVAVTQQPASAGNGAGIVLAERGDGQNWGGGSKGGGQNWNGGGQNWKGGGQNWKGGGENWGGGKGDGNWNKGNNNYNKNWSKNDKNWNGKGDWNKNYGKGWGKGWSNYNNHWNKNWNRRAYVRNWGYRPYYGQFVAGVVLGSLLAASGVGVVPYAPEPYLCWYWADPFMYRGYWDYCY
jgi:hypothetical protein